MRLNSAGMTAAQHSAKAEQMERSKVKLVMPEILNALDEIEHFRSLFVRGDAPPPSFRFDALLEL